MQCNTCGAINAMQWMKYNECNSMNDAINAMQWMQCNVMNVIDSINAWMQCNECT